MQDKSGMLTLTNQRVRLEAVGHGQSKVTSITLDAIASCGLVTKSYPGLLVLGALVGLLGYLSSRNYGSTYSTGAYLIAVVLVGAYFLTRSATLEIGSAAESITVPARGLSHDKLLEFVDAVDESKLSFLAH